jgi:hypothetical protein
MPGLACSLGPAGVPDKGLLGTRQKGYFRALIHFSQWNTAAQDVSLGGGVKEIGSFLKV